MAAERLDMRCVRDVLRLHFMLGQSPRKIAQSLGCGRTTVQDYLSRANQNGLQDWASIEPLSQIELEIRLGFKALVQAFWRNDRKFMPDWPAVHQELSRHKSVTLALLWQEYLEVNAGGYQYTQYCEHYKRWSKKLSVVMRQHHVAGEKTFVDYCDGISLVDAKTGDLIPTELFVGCLGASSYTFAEASLKQDLPSWLGSHVRMVEYFGGSTQITVPDNLKSAVTKPCFYEPVLNESYRDWANHYGTAIIPAHVRKPKHKAKVEVNVLVAQRWILAVLRKRIFHTIEELNTAIRPLLEKLNNRKMRHMKKSRFELFEELDRQTLKPLPAARYEFAQWEKVKLNIDYHIEFDGHFYSAHYTHVHKEMMVRATATVIEIFLRGERIASHRRSYMKGKYTTLKEHMPAHHQAVVKWRPSRLVSWGKSIGPSVGQLVDKILSSKGVPEQGYRSSLGILRLEKKYGRHRLDTACRRALELGALSYGFVAEMLKNNMDQVIVNENEQLSFKTREEKTNTRGRGYYH